MNASISDKGILKIIPGDSTEAYAIKQWLKENSEIYTNSKLNKNIEFNWGPNSLKPKNDE
jgi:hypothetical protein